MKKLRILALLLIVILALPLFSACAPQEQPPASTTPDTGAATTTSAAPPPEPYKGEMPVSAETTQLTFFTHSGSSSNMLEPDNELLYYAETMRKTNVEILWDVVAKDSYSEVLQTKLSSGVNLPDLINMNGAANVMSTYETGLLLPLNGLIDEYGYYLNEWFKNGNEQFREMWAMPDGNLYAVYSYLMPSYGQVIPLYNELWLKEVGKTVPTNLQEFEELLYALKGKDFNKNGKNDEIVLTGSNQANFNHLSSTWGLELFFNGDGHQADKDGKVTCGFVDERYKEMLTFLHKLYKDDILDKELTSNTYDKLYEKAAADRLGVIICYAGFGGTYSNLTSWGVANTDPESPGIFKIGEPLTGPYGDKYILERNIVGGDPISITKDCKNPEAAMKWLDYVYASEENLILRYFGVEGTSYTKDAKGDYIVNIPADYASKNPENDFIDYIYSIGGSQTPMAHRQNMEIRKYFDKPWYYEDNMRLQQYFKPGLIPIAWDKEELDVYNAYRADILSYVREMEGLFISGQKPLTEWDSYLNALQALHLDELTAAYQTRNDRYLKSLQ